MYSKIDKPEIIKGVKFWKNPENKFNVFMLHYSADPEKDPDRDGKLWFEKEKEGAPKSVWDKEYEIDFTTKAGKLIYGPEFCDLDPSIHFINSFQVDRHELIMAMDFGQRNPNCALVAAIAGDGTVYIIDEYYNPAIPSVASREMFDKFSYLLHGYRKESSIGYKRNIADSTFQLKVIDPSTAHKNRTKIIEGEEIPYSVREDFYDNGWDFDTADNDWIAGVTRVREYFRVDKNGKSKLYIFQDKCPKLTWELTRYRYQENTEATNRTHNEPEKPIKKNDHAMDALRYLIMTRPNNPEDAPIIETKIQRDIKRMMAPKVINDFDHS